ncbi:hypothetical protein pmac_cds_583 [Pandoravirus macleodensis]|uniref:Uncharacterized protein n=1 Tax=Pandoravirus macleodensis TaxID=2107707 RepID=A0A2U7UGW5_9VIRU|nr:hypothetical protein pmac_cds_583 [Pandoravirus macleodensis]AVK77271.1 hypothetical protein pmac_cds_583 [Pandoravirus macleodensis]UMO80011.1 hypothetical protein [Pandoravirus aubagnensis]
MTFYVMRCRPLVVVLMVAYALALSTWLPRCDAALRMNGSGAVVRLYQPDVASYCFADRRMQGAPLTCVAASYLNASDALAFGPPALQLAMQAPLPIDAQPACVSVVSVPSTLGADGDATSSIATFAVERSCRPDLIDGRVLCAPADPTDTAAPWAELVQVGSDAHADGLYAMDAVVIRSAQAGGGLCGLVDNVLVCPAANATVFLAVF